MKPIQLFSVLLFAGSILFSGGLAQAQDDVEKSPRPYLGVKLDPNPLPELLVKHLNLDPDMGLLIKNIQQDSPADKAGLEKDDIILRFEGRDVTGYPQFVDAIRSSGVDKEVELEILHNGQRQKIKVTLKLYQYQSPAEWKYPFAKHSARQPFLPGRMFRLDPDNEQWQQIPFPNLPNQKDYFNRFFEQSYHYEFKTKSADGKTDLTINIDGNPNDDGSTITIRTDRKEITTTLAKVDDLPEEYRSIVKDYLDQARQAPNPPMVHLPDFKCQPPGQSPDDWPPQWNLAPNDFIERFERLEKRQDELLERLDKMTKEKDGSK